MPWEEIDQPDPRSNLDLGLQYRSGIARPVGPSDAGKTAIVDATGTNFVYQHQNEFGVVARATVSVPADVGEGWVTLWSETRETLAPIDGDARDIRCHVAIAGGEAIDIASMVWQYQRTEIGVLGDAIVNKDAETLAVTGDAGVEWELTLPVADATIATRAIRIADDVLVQAQAHATIDRVVTIRTYLGPIVNGPYEPVPTCIR